MRNIILLVLLILGWCCGQGVAVEQEVAAEGGGGTEFSLPYGYANFLPGVTAKVSLPLELHPWKPLAGRDVAAGLRFHWSNRVQLYGGNLSFGGPTSLFTTAAPTMTVNPLAGFAFPAATVNVGMPGFGGSSAAYGGAVVASLGRGFAKDRIGLWATGSERKRFFGGVAVPLRLGAVTLGLSAAAGVWHLEGKLPADDDSWFAHSLPYGEIWLKGLALEGRLTWSGLKLYGGGAVVEQPWGGFGYWGRLRFSFKLPVKSVPSEIIGGLSGGLPDAITAGGTKIRESFQAFVNPQARIGFGKRGRDMRLHLGAAFGMNLKNTDELTPQLFSDGKLRGGLALEFPKWKVQLTGEWLGIRLTNKDLKRSLRSEEKYGGSVNLSLHEVVPQVRLGAFGSGHYENRGRHDKDRIVAAGGFSVKPKAAGKLLWLAAVPEVSASTEVTFSRLQGFYSAATDAKASWDIQLPYIKLGVWVAVELKHTTR